MGKSIVHGAGSRQPVVPRLACGILLGFGLVALVGVAVRKIERRPDAEAPATAGLPMSLQLTLPTNGQQYESPADIVIEADAEGLNGQVLVEFYHGPIKIGEARSAPYRCVWKGIRYPGIYEVTAKAVGAQGDATASQRVWVSVERPRNSNP